MGSRTALITGGSRGIGAAIALALAEDCVDIVISYNTNQVLAETVISKIHECGVEAFALQCDQKNPTAITATVAEITDRVGGIDILVNNAAVSQEKPFFDITVSDWDAMNETNLRAPFLWCQNFLPGMIESKWGRIINISSIGGQWGGYNQVHYAAAKAGLINLTRSLAKLFSNRGITANAIAPGLVSTDMTRNELATAAGIAKAQSIPVGRIAEPHEIASVVAFLAGDDASYITGQTINVNGGMYFD